MANRPLVMMESCLTEAAAYETMAIDHFISQKVSCAPLSTRLVSVGKGVLCADGEGGNGTSASM